MTMTKPVLDLPELNEFDKIRLHNIANMFVNIQEDDGSDKAIAYLTAQLKNITMQDVIPFVEAVKIERGYDMSSLEEVKEY